MASGGILKKTNCEEVYKFHKLALYDTTHDYRKLFPEEQVEHFDTVLERLSKFFIPCEKVPKTQLRETNVEDRSLYTVLGDDPFKPQTRETTTGYRYTVVAIKPPLTCQPFYDFLHEQTGTANHAFVVDTEFLHLPERLVAGDLSKSAGKFYWLYPREQRCDSGNKVDIHKKIRDSPNKNRIIICEDLDRKPITYTPFAFKEKSNYKNDFFSTVLVDILRETKHKTPQMLFKIGRFEKIVDNPKTTNTVYNTREKFIYKEKEELKDIFFNYVPFIQKRSGDWLQALATLDKTREYSHTVPDDTTFILITKDKILLAYALAIGVNVLFEKHADSSNPDHLFIYYHNESLQMKDVQAQHLYDRFISSGGDTLFSRFKRFVHDFETLIIPSILREIGELRERYLAIQRDAESLRRPETLKEAFNAMLKAVALYKRYNIFFQKYKQALNNKDAINVVMRKIAAKTRLSIEEIEVATQVRDFVEFFGTEHVRTVPIGAIERRFSLFDNMELYDNSLTVNIEPYVYLFSYMLKAEVEAPFIKAFLKGLKDTEFTNLKAVFNKSFVLRRALSDYGVVNDDEDPVAPAPSPPTSVAPSAPPVPAAAPPPFSLAPPTFVAPSAPPVPTRPVPTDKNMNNLAEAFSKLWKNRTNNIPVPQKTMKLGKRKRANSVNINMENLSQRPQPQPQNNLEQLFKKVKIGGNNSSNDEVKQIFESIKAQAADPNYYATVNYINLGYTQLFINIYDSMKDTLHGYFSSYDNIIKNKELYTEFMLFDLREYIEQEEPTAEEVQSIITRVRATESRGLPAANRVAATVKVSSGGRKRKTRRLRRHT